MVVPAAVLVTRDGVWARGGASFRFGVIALATGVAGLIGARFAPSRTQHPIELGAIALGVAGSLIAGLAIRLMGLVLMAVYIALVGTGAILAGIHPRPEAALIAIAAASIVAALSGVISFVRLGRESKELDRLMFLESTSIAFFVTMLFALTWGLLEVWVNAPHPSMWIVWTVGMVSWIVVSTIFNRRYS